MSQAFQYSSTKASDSLLWKRASMLEKAGVLKRLSKRVSLESLFRSSKGVDEVVGLTV